MRQTSRTIPLLLIIIALSACGRGRGDMGLNIVGLNEAVLEMEDSVHDFGDYSGDTVKLRHTFRMRNAGSDPLVIHQLRASCGCTAADCSTEPVPPGGEWAVTVTYDGAGRTPGAFSKTVDLYTSAKNGLKRLTVRGNKVK